MTMAGTVTGALVGVTAGALLPAGRRWVDLRGERPIRVGAVDLRPVMRVSLAERRR
jgi:ABC-type microcin C transport system permease subunit YejE